MTPEQRALLRQSLLLQLEAAAPATLPPSTLARGTRLAGHAEATDTVVEKELHDLCARGYASSHPSPLSAAFVRFALTPQGRDLLESSPLA